MRYRYSKPIKIKQYWYFKVLWKVYVVNSAWFRSVIYTWLHSYQIAYHTPDFLFLKETDEASSWTPVCSSQLKFEKLSKKPNSFKNQPKKPCNIHQTNAYRARQIHFEKSNCCALPEIYVCTIQIHHFVTMLWSVPNLRCILYIQNSWWDFLSMCKVFFLSEEGVGSNFFSKGSSS